MGVGCQRVYLSRLRGLEVLQQGDTGRQDWSGGKLGQVGEVDTHFTV